VVNSVVAVHTEILGLKSQSEYKFELRVVVSSSLSKNGSKRLCGTAASAGTRMCACSNVKYNSIIAEFNWRMKYMLPVTTVLRCVIVYRHDAWLGSV